MIANGQIQADKLVLYQRGKNYGYQSCKKDLFDFYLESKSKNERTSKINFGKVTFCRILQIANSRFVESR